MGVLGGELRGQYVDLVANGQSSRVDASETDQMFYLGLVSSGSGTTSSPRATLSSASVRPSRLFGSALASLSPSLPRLAFPRKLARFFWAEHSRGAYSREARSSGIDTILLM